MNKGTIGELSCMAYFANQGYDVFVDISGKASFDFIIHKDGELQRVQVKSTYVRTPENTGYQVELKSTRHNRSGAVRKCFNNQSCDLLAVFIAPEQRVVVCRAKDVTQLTRMVVR